MNNTCYIIIPKGFEGSSAQLGGSCGSDGSLFDLVPDNFIGVDILLCCQVHDYRYFIGGNKRARYRADREFRTNLRKTVLKESNILFKHINLHLADLYYKAVREFGESSFNFT
jgi:hypothetical protein